MENSTQWPSYSDSQSIENSENSHLIINNGNDWFFILFFFVGFANISLLIKYD